MGIPNSPRRLKPMAPMLDCRTVLSTQDANRFAQVGQGRVRFLLTQAASVDCLLYLINRGLRRQGISGRSNRHAVSAVPNEDFER
jgi:hypothetical protein